MWPGSNGAITRRISRIVSAEKRRAEESGVVGLAFTMAVFNVLVQWHGLQPYASGFVPLSIAEFSL